MSVAELHMKLLDATAGARSILDVGSGDGHLHQHMDPEAFITSVDWFLPELTKRGYHPQKEIRIAGLIEHVLPLLRDESFDVVIGCDIIEHMALAHAISVIVHMRRIAKRRVCLFVPEGNHPQSGTQENPLQAHVTTWKADDFRSLGFAVTSWPVFHDVPGKDKGAMWCVWERQP